ncbi:MAG TPA: hypothetical protein VF194_11790 [Ferrovibrio sp.]|uniref:hypothetical protein n=1 Tax=Ferrovibrio sp. TaxID=1917215 RepID=UPI002ED599D0
MRGRWEPVSIFVVILGLVASIVAGIAIANSDRETAVWSAGALMAAALWLAAPWGREPRKG